MSKPRFRVLARHKWVSGTTITESVRKDGVGMSIRRFTATIRGFQNWKIYEGPTGRDVVSFVIKGVSCIKDRIDAGDDDIFNRPNYFATIDDGWEKIDMSSYLNDCEKGDLYRWRPSDENTPLSIREFVQLQIFDPCIPQFGWEEVLNINFLIYATRKVKERTNE